MEQERINETYDAIIEQIETQRKNGAGPLDLVVLLDEEAANELAADAEIVENTLNNRHLPVVVDESVDGVEVRDRVEVGWSIDKEKLVRLR